MEYDIYMDMTGAHLFDLDTGVRVCSVLLQKKWKQVRTEGRATAENGGAV